MVIITVILIGMLLLLWRHVAQIVAGAIEALGPPPWLLSMRSELTFVVTAAASFWACWRWAAAQLSASRLVVFCTTMAAATLVLQLVFWELLELGSVPVRAALWRLLINVLLAILGFIYPYFYIDLVIPDRLRGCGMYIVAVAIGYSIYLFGFLELSTHMPIEGSPDGGYSTEWLRQQLLASNALIGITIMAALCGISSVTAPYTAFFANPAPVTDSTITRLTSSINATEEMLAEEQLRLQKLQLESKSRFRKSSTNLLRIFATDETEQRLKECRMEIQSMEKLLIELRSDRDEADRRIRAQAYDATLLGRVGKMVYYLFAGYCVYRLANGYRRMGWWLLSAPFASPGESGPRDALVLGVAQWAHHKYPAYTVENWTRIVGVFMSGCVFTAALNGIFQTMRKLRRRFSPHVTGGPNPLVVSHIFGIYVIALATVLRLNIPKKLSGAITAALEFPLKVEDVQLWNDIVLCGTSSVVLFGILIVVDRGSKSEYDEESLEKYD